MWKSGRGHTALHTNALQRAFTRKLTHTFSQIGKLSTTCTHSLGHACGHVWAGAPLGRAFGPLSDSRTTFGRRPANWCENSVQLPGTTPKCAHNPKMCAGPQNVRRTPKRVRDPKMCVRPQYVRGTPISHPRDPHLGPPFGTPIWDNILPNWGMDSHNKTGS